MDRTKKLWVAVAVVVLGTFTVLGVFGREVYRQAPPIPEQVVTESGSLLMTRDDILRGQRVWQSVGGQQVGSIWGHGAYQAPDWSADWLHREAVALLEIFSGAELGKRYRELSPENRAALGERLRVEMRRNDYDASTGTLTVSDARARAMATTAAHFEALFGDVPALAGLRESYALHPNAVPDPSERRDLTSFFFWTSWACTTERPGLDVTYTNNWPHEELVGNHPTSANLIWSFLSIVLLIAGVGALVWYKSFRDRREVPPEPSSADPLSKIELTPSMRAVWKYAVVVIGLFVLQTLTGVLTAHYTVEGNAFFGIPVAEWIPYAVSRTWHVQLGVFWIATAFLAAGLFLAPAVGGREPRHQRLGVNLLFVALVVVVLGSLAGEWLSVKRHLGLDSGFWFGHQGYEYVDLGRAWQIALFVGLVLWLVLMLRGFWPALKRRDSTRQLVLVFAGASAAIGLFYGAGFLYGAKTHLSVMEYWRWWVVHLWVEGFMEVFATAAMAFIFSRLGLIRASSATAAVLFSTAIFLVGGIPGTFHHLYFSGTPVSIMAVGATFSALEVVPLALIGFEAWGTYKMSRGATWMRTYRWPLRFFLGVAFWNLVGAGVFGFLINPPIALYYMQGLNTTPVHAHTALFGVYGLLALGLTLLVLRRLLPRGEWRDRPLKLAFWAMNGGLALMVVGSLLPIGLAQAAASIDEGLWYARSAEFLQQPVMESLRWLRMLGDTVFLIGVASLVWFVVGLKTGWSFEKLERRRAVSSWGTKKLLASLFVAGAILVVPRPAGAHCDTMDGPVITAARRALELGDVNRVLVWVQPGDEAEIRAVFEQALEARKRGGQAQASADRHFFEQLVRIHREGEGAPYTGIKPAGTPIDPGVLAADHSLETGSVDEVQQLLTHAVQSGLQRHFRAASDLRDYPTEDVSAGRSYVRAYVAYTHFVEGIHEAARSSGHEHEPALGSATSAGHGEHAGPHEGAHPDRGGHGEHADMHEEGHPSREGHGDHRDRLPWILVAVLGLGIVGETAFIVTRGRSRVGSAGARPGED